MSATNRTAALLLLVLAPLVIALTWTASALGAESTAAATAPEAVILVATPQFRDPLYGGTILIAKPMEGGRHVGFILNRPTKYTLSDAFPEHSPSKRVRDPLYLGGPEEIDTVFALVNGHESPGKGSLQLGEDLYLATAAETVDRVIETLANRARFFVGAVWWRPGELKEELRRGVWYVFDPEPDLILPKKTEGLWQELVRRAVFRERGI